MNLTISIPNEPDEKVVARARKRLTVMTKWRWGMLGYGVVFLAVATYPTIRTIIKLESLDEPQLTTGFVVGVGLGILWMTFGLLGGLCVAKFLAGLEKDCREPELLVRYYDRLRELGELPAGQKSEENR